MPARDVNVVFRPFPVAPDYIRRSGAITTKPQNPGAVMLVWNFASNHRRLRGVGESHDYQHGNAGFY
jgi:hypothetical protein